MGASRLSHRVQWERAALVAALACLWAACAVGAGPESVLIEDVPHVRQEPDFCGEACVAMALQKLGHDVTQDHVFNLAGVDPALGRGCVTRELANVLTRIGFKPGATWYRIDTRQAANQIGAQWLALYNDLARGIPSIVCMHTSDAADASEHFRLILGYDAATDEVIYHEPAQDDGRSSRNGSDDAPASSGAYQRMERETFLRRWPLKYKPTEWLVIRMRLVTGRIALPEPAEGFTAADFAQHVLALKPRVPKGFTLVVEPPFVVIGDEEEAVVRRRATKTVKWFSDHVRALYFEKDPPAIYDIWLFHDKTSYRKYAKALFGDEPSTPFGYFSQANGALVMNIGTGGGTLCHEMVHAFMPSNFPECPSWFNEGLASLYEQCSERDHKVIGLTNWRLAGLQKVIKDGSLPSFNELCSTTTRQFYAAGAGNNYAQARYLCYYLQERGLLVKYYHAFVENADDDASGYDTLKKALGLTSDEQMAAFQKRWQQWVLKLRFP